ncbi:MAG: hypothetical protein IT457_05235 [Planctomycetes bacterium]|nr:hypothetical protein [Planctomycetota bacterium]
MRLELAERLRCPNPHAPTPLVVVSRRKRDRELLEGFAGCPVCRLEARITAGHVQFEGTASAPAFAPTGAAPELERVIALLGLSEPGGAVMLTGRYAALAEPLAMLTEAAVVVMHAETGSASDGVSAVLGALSRVPFTDATFRGAALDDGTPRAIVEDAVRTVAPEGRVLASVALTMPAGLKELARDDHEWVAARVSVDPVVELRRRQ